MKSLLITRDFYPEKGGVQTAMYHLAKHYSHPNIIVLAPKVQGCEEFDKLQNFKIFRVPYFLKSNRSKLLTYPFRFLTLLFRANSIIKKERVRSIQCGYAISGGSIGFVLKKMKNIPYFVYVYGAEIFGKKEVFKSLLLTIMRNAEKVFAISNFTKRELIKMGVPQEKVEVIFFGVDLERFKNFEKVGRIRRDLGLVGKKVLLTVGRIVERKGHDTVIKSLSKIREDFPNVKYLIVGEGENKKNLIRLASEIGVSDSVIFAGYVSDEELPNYYKICDLFVMPSREIKDKSEVEGYGLVYLEANACKKTVIGGRSGGVSDAIIDNQSGILVDPLNEEEVARTIIKLLKDTRLRRRLGKKGFERVKEELNWSSIVKRIEDIIK